MVDSPFARPARVRSPFASPAPRPPAELRDADGLLPASVEVIWLNARDVGGAGVASHQLDESGGPFRTAGTTPRNPPGSRRRMPNAEPAPTTEPRQQSDAGDHG